MNGHHNQNSNLSQFHPRAVDYFFGRISREEAESYLKNKGPFNGLYLLRESVVEPGNYVLSICNKRIIHHYSIKLQADGQYMIPEGRKFPGPIELIHHHSKYLDGFLVKPREPCVRPKNTSPLAWPGVTMIELEKMLIFEAQKENFNTKTIEYVFGPQRQKFVEKVASRLHEDQPWFHGDIKRKDAVRFMQSYGHSDGMFLVRRRDNHSFALSLSYGGECIHYKIDAIRVDGKNKLAIEEGKKFDNLMDLIAFYHNRMGGLLYKLTNFCVKPGWVKKKINLFDESGVINNPLYGGRIRDESLPKEGDFQEPEDFEDNLQQNIPPTDRKIYDTVPRTDDIFNIKNYDLELGQVLGHGNFGFVCMGTYKVGNKDVPVAVKTLKSEDITAELFSNRKIGTSLLLTSNVPRTDDIFNIKFHDLELGQVLGYGNFGFVCMGTYKVGNKDVPVAVKLFKNEDITAEQNLINEAKLMSKLDHQHIIRMIGVCRSDKIMLVLERADRGPLNKFLLKPPKISMNQIELLMNQVAQGMAYLESNHFVHRDLAARNVLLDSELNAKISDFGMSKALGIGSNYYKANETGKWPLKWYALECLFFYKFDSKSDVWSYGVTLWEATSFGEKPYKGMKGAEILSMLESGERMKKPPECPNYLYDLMLMCWQRNSEDRPTFKQIVEIFNNF